MGVHPSYSRVSSMTRATHVADALASGEERREGRLAVMDDGNYLLMAVAGWPGKLHQRPNVRAAASAVLDELKPSIIQLARRSIICCHLPFSFRYLSHLPGLACGLFRAFVRSFACPWQTNGQMNPADIMVSRKNVLVIGIIVFAPNGTCMPLCLPD